MKFAILSLIAAAASVAAQTMINTPASVVQCLPVLITWNGTAPPYTVDIVPGGVPGAPALQNLGTGLTGDSLTWTANIAAGTSITFQIRDATGYVGSSAPVTVQPGTSSSCLTASGSASPGASASGSSAASPSAATTTRATTSPAASASASAPPATTPTAPASSSRPTTSAPAASPSANAATALVGSAFGAVFAGVFAAVLAF